MKPKGMLLKTKLLLVLLGSTLTLLLVMGAAMYYSASQIIRAELSSSTAMMIDKSALELEMYLEKLAATAAVLAENPQVCRSFANSHSDPATLQDRKDVETIIDAILAANTDIRSIMLIGSDGSIVSNEEGISSGDRAVMEEWYQEVLKGMMPVLSSARMQHFSMDRDNWVISYGRTLQDLEGQLIGVLRIDLKYEAIENLLSGLGLGDAGYAYILNGKNQVVYHKDTAYFGSDQKRQELLEMTDMPDEALIQEGLLVHQAVLVKADWRLIGVTSLDALDRMQRDIILALWLLGLLLLVLSVAGSSWLSGRIAKPVETLVRAQEKEIRERELMVLNAQINPHFLYNTLDTIVWLAETGKNDRVVDVTKAMARFFRLSLRGGSDLTTVRDELDHVRQYLYIQKQRYGDKLCYEVVADDAVLDVVIPKILLQPLVENAIYHGIRKNENGGTVRVTAEANHKQKTAVRLIVSDDGPGFDASVPVSKPDTERLSGVGLQNIDERLRLLYGEKATLRIETTEGSGTSIYLTLPAEFPKRV